MKNADVKPIREGREEEAERVLGQTEFGPWARGVLVLGFLLGMLAVPMVQFIRESGDGHGDYSLRGIFRVVPGWERVRSVRSTAGLWRLLPEARQLKEVERDLEKRSWFSGGMRPGVQEWFTGVLGSGGEQAYVGKGGWLFYRPDVESVVGPPFLDAGQMAFRRKAGVQPDPVRAVVHFRDQLRGRGIELVVMPVPVKPCVEGGKLGWVPDGGLVHNASHEEFLARLQGAGVRVFDPGPGLIADAREWGAAYLETDTHWRPEAVARVAERLAGFLREGAGVKSPGLQTTRVEREVEGMGDTVGLLGLSGDQKLYPRQKVRIRQVLAGNGLLRPDPGAEVLVLGDSFSNIYSLEGMGWGEGAGLVEQLGAELGARVDGLVRNSDGAFGSREVLRRELAAGRDRLAGKRVVVWEFASRELAVGDWKILDLQLGAKVPGHFLGLKSGEEFLAEGTVAAVSGVPRPGTVPYAEHIVSVHLVDVAEADGKGGAEGAGAAREALVYLWSMRGQEWTPAARLRSGDRVRVRLRSWETVSGQYEKVNRSELTDAALVAEEPVWGELVGGG